MINSAKWVNFVNRCDRMPVFIGNITDWDFYIDECITPRKNIYNHRNYTKAPKPVKIHTIVSNGIEYPTDTIFLQLNLTKPIVSTL